MENTYQGGVIIIWAIFQVISLSNCLIQYARKTPTECKLYFRVCEYNLSYLLCSKRAASKGPLKPDYECSTHGHYRSYNDYLKGMKNWAVVWVSIAIIPLTLILHVLNVSLISYMNYST